jgi:hypothetical protein
MSLYQQIPGNIRSLLATKAQRWTDHAADLANQYAAMCDETNQRLRRCTEYLRRGMTSAAIHLAECQPNLIQAVNWLQFPERSAWADLCVTNGMRAPAVLEAECIEKINAIADRERVLQPLHSRHRLLAIAKAPARARLEVTRMLAVEDPENPAWGEEILGLETVRLGELAVEVQAAQRQRNEAAMQALAEELTVHPWRRSIPGPVRDPLQKFAERITAQRVSGELPALATTIASTLRLNPPLLPELLRRWRDLCDTPGVPMPADLKAQVQPALDWQAAEQKRKRDLEEVKPLEHLFVPSEPSLIGGPNRHFTLIIFFIVIGLFALFAVGVWVYFTFIKGMMSGMHVG